MGEIRTSSWSRFELTTRAGLTAGALVASLWARTPAAAQELPPLPTFRGRPIVLTDAQQAALARGEPVVRLLDTPNPRDIAAIGIVAVDVSRSFFNTRLTDLTRPFAPPGRIGFGVFSVPATAADVEPLAFSANDIAPLRSCRTGSCPFKLPAAEMTHTRAILDTSRHAAPARVTAYARERAVDYVNAYHERGNDALVIYDDNGTGGVRASEAFAALLTQSSWIGEQLPLLGRFLQDYPRDRPEGATDVITWARDEIPGVRTTLTVNQVVVYSPADHPELTVSATKQLFANHYFEAALDLLIARDRPAAAAGTGTWVILLRQRRMDNLPTGGPLNIRGRARSGMREQLTAELKLMQKQYQAAFAQR